MNEREREVFELIVDHYLKNGESLGSRTLEKKYNIGFSSATIRNVMSDLEQMGLITKTHSSSGRIPTLEGYKIYIDQLLRIEKLNQLTKDKIFEIYEMSLNQTDEIFIQTTKILSKLTDSVAIALEPALDDQNIKKVQFIRINNNAVFVVVIMENDMIKTTTLTMNNQYITEENVHILNEYINNLINTTHKNLCLKELEGFLKNLGQAEFDVDNKKIFDNNKIFVNGTTNLLNNSDKSLDEIAQIVQLANDKSYLKDIFQEMALKCEYNTEKPTIIFGKDVDEKLEDYVFIFQCYNFGNEKGLLGMVSHTRVNYSKVVSILETTIQILKLMLNRNKEKKYLCNKI